jgi:hypothetical protein
MQAAFRLTGMEVRSVTYGERHVVINWRIGYVLRALPAILEQSCAFTLPLTTLLTLDEKGSRILHHDDHWSLHELVEGVPLVGTIYRLGKRMSGAASSMLTNLLWGAFASSGGVSTTAASSIASPSSTAMGSLGTAAPPSDATLAASSTARSARGISSGTVTSVGSGARSSIGSGGVGGGELEDEKTLTATSD